MRADIGGRQSVILHLRRRRARGQILSTSGKQIMVGVILAAALLAGLGVITQRANSAQPSHPLAWLGR